MSYVESFETEMSRARIRMADYNSPYLDHLQAAHDAEMKQLSKAEFHRGYESGVATRDVSQWKLDRMRNAAIQNLQAVEPSELCGSHEILSAICKAIFEPPMGWTIGAGEILRDHLVYLLGGESINNDAETSAKVVKNGEKYKQERGNQRQVVQNGEKYQLATDVLGNERHEAVCELRGISVDELCKKYDYIDIYPEFMWSIGRAIGLRHGAGFKEIISRLIYLLGADTILKEDGDGMARGDFERGTVPYDSVGARDVPEEAVVDECNFSGAESYIDAQDDGANPAETSNSHSDSVSFGTPSSITDELRTWVRDHIWQHADNHTGLIAIADRIDEQFSRICSQQEAVLQQTISDAVDEHEREMAELRADYERATKLQRQYGKEVAELQSRYDRLSAIRDDMTMVIRQYIDDTNELLSGHVTKGNDNG